MSAVGPVVRLFDRDTRVPQPDNRSTLFTEPPSFPRIELARWRYTAFVAVSGRVDGGLMDAGFHAAFKARTGQVVAGGYVDPRDGIYLTKGPGAARILTLVETGMAGTRLDPEAFDPDTSAALPVTEMGIERDGFRGNFLVVNASMGGEETGWGGIYLTEVWK